MLKKIIAPLVITIITIAYFLFYAYMCFVLLVPVFVKIVCGVIAVALICCIIFVFIERVNEIKGGEEDDLSKY